MFNNILKQLKIISSSSWYWWLYIIGGLIALAVALYHQHILEQPPCLLCIQIRLWISLLIMVAFTGLLLRHQKVINSAANLSMVVVAIGLTERCYQLLGTERGFVFGDCGFNLGLPTWFAIEEWLPWLYRVETTCGYTPEILFNITMAEALMVSSVLFLLISLCVFLLGVFPSSLHHFNGGD